MVDDVRPSAIAPVVDVAHLWSLKPRPEPEPAPHPEPEPLGEQTGYIVTVKPAHGKAEKARTVPWPPGSPHCG